MIPSLQTQFDKLETQRINLLARFANIDDRLWKLSPAKPGQQQTLSFLGRLQTRLWNVPPTSGEWSCCEIFQHLILAEKEVLRQARENKVTGDKRNLRDLIGGKAVQMALKYGWRVRAPLASVVPQAMPGYQETCNSWTEVRHQLAAYLAEITPEASEKPIFYHPVAGKMNIGNGMVLIFDHINHHTRQLNNINNHFGNFLLP